MSCHYKQHDLIINNTTSFHRNAADTQFQFQYTFICVSVYIQFIKIHVDM